MIDVGKRTKVSEDLIFEGDDMIFLSDPFCTDKSAREYRKFTEEDYQKLQDNIVRYKGGDIEASNYIIRTFHQFINKYVKFICYGNLSGVNAGKDKSISKFVNLFSTYDRKISLSTDERHKIFAATCNKIYSLFSKFEYLDIYNELVCALLNMAHKYKITEEGDKYHHKNGSFHMYVSKCFHFEAYNALTKIIKDPLTHLETYSISQDNFSELGDDTEWQHSYNNKNGSDPEDQVISCNHSMKSYILKDTNADKTLNHMMSQADRIIAMDHSENLVLKEDKEVDPYDLESLNFNWTNGTTCGELFQDLNSYEREILVMSFIQNKTDSEIASIYGCHRVTIVNHKKKIIKKIREAANRNNIL